MTYEDFTTYAKGGAQSSKISTTTTRTTVEDLYQSDEAWCYKDKGTGHFSGDFDHKLDVKIETTSQRTPTGIWRGNFWALANIVNDWVALYSGSDRGLTLRIGIDTDWGADVFRLNLWEITGANSDKQTLLLI